MGNRYKLATISRISGKRKTVSLDKYDIHVISVAMDNLYNQVSKRGDLNQSDLDVLVYALGLPLDIFTLNTLAKIKSIKDPDYPQFSPEELKQLKECVEYANYHLDTLHDDAFSALGKLERYLNGD